VSKTAPNNQKSHRI